MKRREPDFNNMLKVLRREVPDRPVLFELFMNQKLYDLVNGEKPAGEDELSIDRTAVKAFAKLGYDYATVKGSRFAFPIDIRGQKDTISLNECSVIFDEASFDAYRWPDPDAFDYSKLGKLKADMPDGMKLMIMCPGGVLENVTYLMGYDNLCLMLYDEPELVKRVFDEVGERLVRYYKNCLEYDTVGMIVCNDDWGFNTQPFLSPDQMREYVIPWHEKIVKLGHEAGRPVILHSCGNLKTLIDDIVGMGYDAKHSYEDNIFPVEEAYEAWHERIAILGGMDVDFVIRRPAEEIRSRVAAMMERTATRGGWAIGTGNSVPEYIPVGQYLAMVETALGYNPLEK